jgi:Malonyl-CoA decarboxylase (MCD).
MNRSQFLAELLLSVADGSRRMLDRVLRDDTIGSQTTEQLCERLLSGRGEASGAAYAAAVLERWRNSGEAERLQFLEMLRVRFGVDHRRLDAAIDAYRAAPDEAKALAVHAAAEPIRQDLLRRLNLAPGGVETLVRMREDLIVKHLPQRPDFAPVDADFVHLFSSWFNPGFLVLKRIDWTTSANVLEKIIRYEAVHEIDSWDDLRRRLEPEDRRCFAFFHPQLPDDPLIFVEVALTREMPAAIGSLLKEDRIELAADEATTAVFYSISNCQEGLRGISFGNFLIKQVVEDLRRDLPRLTDFVTLSPVPGFVSWLEGLGEDEAPQGAAEARELIADRAKMADTATRDRLAALLPPLAAHYFLVARTTSGRVIDPVARFHLGNGARLERINAFGDLSPKALRTAAGLMVNYRYRLDEIEKNHERFATQGEVVAAPAVRGLLRDRKPARKIPAA